MTASSGFAGQTFSPGEAREASDFGEVLRNWKMEPDDAYNIFKGELSVAKRLFLAWKMSSDVAVQLLFEEEDERIRKVIQARFADEREDTDIVIIAR